MQNVFSSSTDAFYIVYNYRQFCSSLSRRQHTRTNHDPWTTRKICHALPSCQNVLDLEARVRSQEQEIQTLKNQKASDDNVTANKLNKLMSEYIDIKTAFGLIKQEFDRNNNQTGLQTLKTRLDNMAQSVRYLTLSLHGHEIHNEEMNMTIHRELNHLNAKLVNEIQALHKEIMNLTNIESADINRLEAILSVHQTNLTTLESEMAIFQQIHLQNVSNS